MTFQGPKDLHTECGPTFLGKLRKAGEKYQVRQRVLLVNLQKERNWNSQNYLGRERGPWQLLWSDSVETIDLSPSTVTQALVEGTRGRDYSPAHCTIYPHSTYIFRGTDFRGIILIYTSAKLSYFFRQAPILVKWVIFYMLCIYHMPGHSCPPQILILNWLESRVMFLIVVLIGAG